MTALSLYNVSKQFQPPKQSPAFAICDLSLEIEQGEIVMVTGPIGSGKTTLMQLLAGLIKPEQGLSYILEENPFDMPVTKRLKQREKNIGLYFSHLPLLSECSVAENIALPLYIDHSPKEFVKNQVEETANFFGITRLLTQYPDHLSLGEKQLVSLARAFVHQPKIAVLDEPTSALDHSSAVMFLTHLRELVINHNLTAVITTGDVRLHPFATRVVRLHEGQIREILGEKVSDEAMPPFLQI